MNLAHGEQTIALPEDPRVEHCLQSEEAKPLLYALFATIAFVLSWTCPDLTEDKSVHT